MRAAADVRRQRPPWLHGHVVPDEREVGDLVRQRRRQGKVQEDLRSLRLVLLYRLRHHHIHTRSRAVVGPRRNDAAAVMHSLAHTRPRSCQGLIHDPVASVLNILRSVRPDPRDPSAARPV